MKFYKFLTFSFLFIVLYHCKQNKEPVNESIEKEIIHKPRHTENSFIYTSFGDTIIRHYPDKAIPDSLAVVEGLKTKVFGIAISKLEKNIYIFLNDSTFFACDLSINRHIHVFDGKKLNRRIRKFIIENKSIPNKSFECDSNYIEYLINDNNEIGYSISNNYVELAFASINQKGLDIIDLFDIGMSKTEFFNNLGFNDIPIDGDFTLYIVNMLYHITEKGNNIWYEVFLPKLTKYSYGGGAYEMEYKLIFKKNKIVEINIINNSGSG